jgi:predicted permease
MALGELWRRIAFLLRRSRRLDDLDQEMQLHLELRERQLREQGLATEPAARAAQRQFGDRTRLRERIQDSWGWGWFDGLVGDLRHGLRLLRGKPLFAVVVVLTLALGIGPNAAMFSVMNAIVMRHLPVKEPDRLVYLRSTGQPRGMSNTGNSRATFSYSVFAQLRERRDAVSDVMAFVPLSVARTPVRHGAIPEEASALMVSGNFFTGLGVGATCGRLLDMPDEAARAQVVVLSHDYWSRRFGSDCGVVGRTLTVKGTPFTIVGVAAAGFVGLDRASSTDFWLPFQDRPNLNAWGMTDKSFLHQPSWWCLMLIARLAPGVTEEGALARLQPAFVNAAYAHVSKPAAGEEVLILSFGSTKGIAGLRDSYGDPLVLLFAMVALVLVIACGNVALLLVARNATRQREFALRLALGGGHLRLLRQLLAESLLLVGAAALLGWLFAVVATDALGAWSGLNVDLTPDLGVVLFTLGVSVVATLVFGLAPLRSAASSPLNAGLRSMGSSGGHERAWVRRTVVALQVGLCLVLLVGAGLLVRTMRNLEQIPLGMRTAGLLVFGVSPQHRAQSHPQTVQFYQDLLARFRALPEVESVTLMENRIGSGWSNNTSVWVDGRSPETDGAAPVRWNSVGPDYFRTLGTPLLQGRDLRESDGMAAPRVAVVNQTFVRRYIPDGNALGCSIDLSGDSNARRFQIVGVVADSKYTGVREDLVPMAYFSYQQMNHVSAMHVEVRMRGDPEQFLPVAQRVVRELAPDLPIEQPRTQQQQFAMNLVEDRIFARLAAFFGLLAIVLVATGLYGTLAFAVNRRTAEIGVRMALGAQAGHVRWMVLRESLIVCAAGIAIGLPLALAGSGILRSMLYGVAPGDPVTIALSLVGLLLVALVASWLPARRATSVQPMVALRAE